MGSRTINFVIGCSFVGILLLMSPPFVTAQPCRAEVSISNGATETAGDIKVPLRVDGHRVADLRVGDVWAGQLDFGSGHRIEVPEFLYTTNATRIHFPQSSFVLTCQEGTSKHVFIFQIEDRIRVSADPVELELRGLARVTERSVEWGVGFTHEPPPKTEMFLKRGSTIRLLAQPFVVGTPGEEYKFLGFRVAGALETGTQLGRFYRGMNLTISGPATLGAVYEKYYLVQVEATPGASSEDWHPAGERLALTAADIVPMDGITGLLGGRYRFEGWDIDGKLTAERNISFEVNSPTRIKAEFAEDYSQIWLYAILSLVATTAILTMVVRNTDS